MDTTRRQESRGAWPPRETSPSEGPTLEGLQTGDTAPPRGEHVARRFEHSHEDRRLMQVAGLGGDDRHGLPRVVGEQPLAGTARGRLAVGLWSPCIEESADPR